MLEKIDSGNRKLSLKCDQFGIMARSAHTRTFKAPNAEADAIAFARANGFEDRAVIEVIMEMPYVPPIPSAPVPELTPERELTDEEQAIEIIAEMIILGESLITILHRMRGRSTKSLRSNLTKLTRMLRNLERATHEAL